MRFSSLLLGLLSFTHVVSSCFPRQGPKIRNINGAGRRLKIPGAVAASFLVFSLWNPTSATCIDTTELEKSLGLLSPSFNSTATPPNKDSSLNVKFAPTIEEYISGSKIDEDVLGGHTSLFMEKTKSKSLKDLYR